MLLCLVNFLAYFEAEETTKEEVEREVQHLKNQVLANEKRLVEEERHLEKCKQVWIGFILFILSRGLFDLIAHLF